MRKLVLKMSMSVDGFVSGPNGEVDWIFRTAGGDAAQWVVGTLRQAGAHLMGSRTYYDMAAFWPYSDAPFAQPMNDIPKADLGAKPRVAPTPAVLASWAEPTVADGDLAEEVTRLKNQPGDFLLAHGGARFAQSLVATGLIDEYRLVIHPVVLGQGLPLFAGLRAPADLRLISATPCGSGVVGAVYQAA